MDAAPRRRLEALEQGELSGQQLGAGLVQREPRRLVDLGEAALLARTGRPLHLEGVARGGARVDVAVARPTPARAFLPPDAPRRGRGAALAARAVRALRRIPPRRGAAGSSSSPYSPLGIDHAPASLRAQKGPPGCTRSTSISPSALRGTASSPALTLGTAPHRLLPRTARRQRHQPSRHGSTCVRNTTWRRIPR